MWAVMASPMKPSAWQSSEESFTLSLGQGWEKGLSEFFEHLARSRDYKGGENEA